MIKKTSLYKLISTLLYLTTYIIASINIYFGFILMILFILYSSITYKYKNILNKNVIIFISINFFVVFIGLIMSIVNDSSSKDILRDVINTIFPSISLIYGYIFFSKYKMNHIYNTIVQGGLAIAFYQLFNFIKDPTLFLQSLRYIRIDNDASNFLLPTLAVLVVLFLRRYSEKYFNFIIILILSASIILSLSRTNYIIFMLISLFLLIVRPKNTFVLKNFFGVILLLAIGFTILPAHIRNEIFGKMIHSITEVKGTGIWDFQEINSNWRGYENYLIKQQLSNTSLLNQLFGFGFGERLQLGVSISLAGSIYTAIPQTHSEYYYFLFKTGILGLTLIIIMHIYLLKFSRNIMDSVSRHFAISLSIIIAVEAVVVRGFLIRKLDFYV